MTSKFVIVKPIVYEKESDKSQYVINDNEYKHYIMLEDESNPYMKSISTLLPILLSNIDINTKLYIYKYFTTYEYYISKLTNKCIATYHVILYALYMRYNACFTDLGLTILFKFLHNNIKKIKNIKLSVPDCNILYTFKHYINGWCYLIRCNDIVNKYIYITCLRVYVYNIKQLHPGYPVHFDYCKQIDNYIYVCLNVILNYDHLVPSHVMENIYDKNRIEYVFGLLHNKYKRNSYKLKYTKNIINSMNKYGWGCEFGIH